MLKTIRTMWYNKHYYLIKEESKLFRLYIDNIYQGEMKNFQNYDKILPFKFNEMEIKFINELNFNK